ncbi:penicillin acylase family protein [Pseudochelatococcus lubricantis]|uniref:penicillin acylase family protein n=1 Tax=Pseudochelatococcus lubricantis TaxID=1538102 RepID=UPI0035EC7906
MPGNAPAPIVVEGLQEPVEIAVDTWGVAHIRARNRDDLFFAQGWNVARDRLWQIDLWRKRGLGLLAADFGPGYLEQDRAARLFLYRGDMAAEWAAYGSDAQAICASFAAGINAYIAGIEAGAHPLPPEFAELGNAPSRWAAEDVVRIRSHSLTRNATSEILRARLTARAGAAADELRLRREPPVVPQTAPDLDLASLPLAILDDFNLAVAPVSFSAQRLAATPAEASRWRRVAPTGEIVQAVQSEGSNNWAVSAEKSATGRPILALDPHRIHTLPSIRYVVHLSMPGFDAIGAGEPAVPGISMGHNGTAAFALTIFGADQEDVFVYDTHPDDPLSYRFGDGWERMTECVEDIPVRGSGFERRSLYFTRHGPVIHRDPAARRAYALRTVWTDAGMAPYMASLAVMRARSFDAYTQALRGWGTPSVNHVYADLAGTIGWKPSGATPLREGWNGLLPVPGDGRYAWVGYLAPEDGPVERNPARGFIATANAMNVPADWAATHPPIGYEWLDASRSDRIHDVVSRRDKVTLDDCARLQNDTFSVSAARLVSLLGERYRAGGDAASAHALLRAWDGDLRASSGAAALFEIWLSRHIGNALGRAAGLADEDLPLLQPVNLPAIADWVRAADEDVLQTTLDATLSAAWAECRSLMGEDPAAWAWGDIHRLSLKHPLDGIAEGAAVWSMPPVRLGGSSSTPNYAGYRASNLDVTTGPSVRMIIDVGGWDNSLFVNTPGQSGLPGSPHYGDLATAWRDGEYYPLVYSRDAVDAATRQLFVCVPG